MVLLQVHPEHADVEYTCVYVCVCVCVQCVLQ
jgi:hypothetical protein